MSGSTPVKTAASGDSRAASPTLAPSSISVDKEMRDEKVPAATGSGSSGDDGEMNFENAEGASVAPIHTAAEAHGADHGLTKIETSNSHVGSHSIARTATREDGTEYPKGMRLAIIMLALCLAVFLMALDNSIIATAIPKITDQFHSLDDIGWYASGTFQALIYPLIPLCFSLVI